MNVQEILSRLDGVKQTKYGASDWLCRCPAHADNSPSLHISLNPQRDIMLHCFAGCELEDILSSLDLEKRDLFSGEKAPLYVPAPKKDYKKPDGRVVGMWPDLEFGWHEWLSQRGIDALKAEEWGVRGDNRSILFPFFRDGIHINTQTRFIDPKDEEVKGFKMEPDCEITWFGLDDARRSVEKGAETLYICEGLIDWLTLKQHDSDLAVLSVPNGASAKEMDWFNDAEGIFTSVSRVRVAVDSDGPGQKLEAELIRRIGPEVCQRVRWPDGCNDANDVLVLFGRERVAQCLDAAYDIPIDGIISPLDLTDSYLSLYRNGLQRGVSCGWK